MNVIKGIVTSGSYIGCNVIILNEGFLSNGKIRIKSFNEICKYNVCLVTKPLKSEGKKLTGQTTYLNKESILLQPNCRCKNETCLLSHVEDKGCQPHSPPSSPSQPPSPPSQPPSPPSHFRHPSYPNLFRLPSVIDFDTLLYNLYQKYINHPGKSSIVNMQISYQNLKMIQMQRVSYFSQESYTNAFICVASLSLRVLLENYCKEISKNNYSTARELVYLMHTNGHFTHEQEKFACEILTFTNNIIHSCNDINQHFISIEKIKSGLLFLLSLN